MGGFSRFQYRKAKRGILGVLSIIFITCACSHSRRDHFYLEANKQLKEKNYDQAIQYYNEALKIDPLFADAWNNRGIALYQDRQYAEAVESYNRAISSDYKDPHLYLNRSNALYQLRNFKGSLADLRLAERWLPDSSIIPFMKGTIYFHLFDYDSARDEFIKYLVKDSSNMEAFVNAAAACYYLNDLDGAYRYVRKALDRDPGDPDAENVNALVWLGKREPSLALAWVNRALSSRPGDAYFLNNRGAIYLELDSLDLADHDISASLRMDPSNGWAYRNKGVYYLKKNRLNDALLALQQAIRLDGNINEVYYNLGRVYELLGRKEDACASYESSMTRGEATGKNAYQRLCGK